MKAIRVHTPGGPEALRLEDIPEPKPEAGQAVVKIEAAGVNFIDVYQRTGLYKVALPFTLGQEAAGTVAALGTGVSEPRVGTRVAYCGILGAYAPYAPSIPQYATRVPTRGSDTPVRARRRC